jgi:ABC-type multidrug transport system ATPase subunit
MTSAGRSYALFGARFVPRAVRGRTRVVLARLREEGRTILLSTHRLHEIERRCDRFVIIDSGRIVAEGTVAVNLLEASDQPVNVVERMGAFGVTRQLHALPSVSMRRNSRLDTNGVFF